MFNLADVWTCAVQVVDTCRGQQRQLAHKQQAAAIRQQRQEGPGLPSGGASQLAARPGGPKLVYQPLAGPIAHVPTVPDIQDPDLPADLLVHSSSKWQ